MKSVKNIGDIKGKRVILRADFNVPLVNNLVGDDFRIIKTFPILDFLSNAGAKIIIISHIEGEKTSLRPVYENLKDKYKISFVEDYFPETPQIITEISDGDIVLLENLRKYSGEKENDYEFSKHLASFGDLYINEAFPVSHRKHASVVGIPKYLPSFAGFVFEEEVENLSKAFSPEKPFLFVLGGAKFETKIPLVQKFFNLADKVFIGGALANDFFRAKGIDTGSSLLSNSNLDLSGFMNEKLILPSDLIIKNEGEVLIKRTDEVSKSDVIVDVGPASIESLKSEIARSKFILWNGPLGNYELGFRDATLSLAKNIAESEALAIVGGGDTIASIASLGIEDKFSFISTGGGAMLEFLANETLPGIEALES